MASTTATATTLTKTTLYSPLTFRLLSLQSAVAQAYANARRFLLATLYSSTTGSGHAPYPGDTEMSIPWLTATLQTKGGIPHGATIISADFLGLDGNRGLAGVMTKILVTYTLPSSKDKDDIHQVHLIMKRSADSRLRRLANIISGSSREVIFYGSDIAKSLLPSTLLPKIYYTHGSIWLGEYVVVMEDIKKRRAEELTQEASNSCRKPPVDVNFVFGNQIWGVPDSVDRASLPPSADMLDQMFLTAAEMHAQHWNDQSLFKLDWLKSTGWYKGSNRAVWEWSLQAADVAWEKGKAMSASGKFDVKYSEKFVKIMDSAFKRASWERLQKRLQDKTLPFTLTHGDFHAANMILDRSSPTEAPSICMYDWSEVCIWEPTTDLGQTIISDVPVAVFKTHARTALRKYWDRLIELGAFKPEAYPFETCWKSFVRGGVEKWLWTFGILCSYPGMPANAVQYFHDQMLAFIELAGDVEDDFYDITTVVCFAPPNMH
ncbi:hypothetical protein BKA57DRAFT_444803 [Linnemannia elongata]|nr:hypothetical protein BKA57DRAFT_444803 [Linnemannia elongata]